MPFISPEGLATTELFPEALTKLATGKHIMLSFLEMQHGVEIPEHSHPEEQAGLLLEGELLLRIGEDEKTLAPGD